MQRLPFVFTCKPEQKTAGLQALRNLQDAIKTDLNALGADNVSIWGIQDFLFCYGEYPDDVSAQRSGSHLRHRVGNADCRHSVQRCCNLPVYRIPEKTDHSHGTHRAFEYNLILERRL